MPLVGFKKLVQCLGVDGEGKLADEQQERVHLKVVGPMLDIFEGVLVGVVLTTIELENFL